jgi:hypothetical protein
MAKVTYDKDLTGLLVIDPYNDFISEGGKIWDRRASLAERTLNPFHGSPADFGQLVADAIRMWREVVRVSGVKP